LIKKSSEHISQLMELGKTFIEEGYNLKVEAGGFSMFPYLRKGDLLIIKSCKFDRLRIGDIIVFRSNEKYIAHRLVRKKRSEDKMWLIPKGDFIPKYDFPVGEETFIGKVIAIKKRNSNIDLERDSRILINYMIAKMAPVMNIALKFIRVVLRGLRKIGI